MKTIKSAVGPLAERPYYKPSEIERICADELRAYALLPDTPGPVRIDRFIEKRFKIFPRYETLPQGVLGFTVFGAEGVREIVVSRELDEAQLEAAERQVRTTLAHEAGHGLLHAHLFALVQSSKSLFGDHSDPSKPKVLCRDVPVCSEQRGKGYDGRWWEFQANQAIGGLLLPRRLVQVAAEPFLTPQGMLGLSRLSGERRPEAIRALAEIFEVNPVVAKIRLQTLFPASEDRQLLL